MEKKFLRMPKGLLVRLHPVQILVFICRAKQPHGLRRMWGFGLSAHLVWGCGGLLRGLFVLRFAAQLLNGMANAACGGNFSIGLIGVFPAHSHVSAHVLACREHRFACRKVELGNVGLHVYLEDVALVNATSGHDSDVFACPFMQFVKQGDAFFGRFLLSRG